MARYNVPPVKSTKEDKEEGMCRILYNWRNNVLTNVVRAVKIDKVHKINERYQVSVNLFAEVGVLKLEGERK